MTFRQPNDFAPVVTEADIRMFSFFVKHFINVAGGQFVGVAVDAAAPNKNHPWILVTLGGWEEDVWKPSKINKERSGFLIPVKSILKQIHVISAQIHIFFV